MAFTINIMKEILELISNDDFDGLKYKEILNKSSKKSSDFKAGAHLLPPPPPPVIKIAGAPLPPPPPPMQQGGIKKGNDNIQQSLFEIYNGLKKKENFKTILDDILQAYIKDILFNGCLHNGVNDEPLKLEIMKSIKDDLAFFLENSIKEGMSLIHSFVSKNKNSYDGLVEIKNKIKDIIQNSLDEHREKSLKDDPTFKEYVNYKNEFLKLSDELNNIKLGLTPDKYHVLKNLDSYKRLVQINDTIDKINKNLTYVASLKRDYEKLLNGAKSRVSEKMLGLKAKILEDRNNEKAEREVVLGENALTSEREKQKTKITVLENNIRKNTTEMREVAIKEINDIKEDELKLLRKSIVPYSNANEKSKETWFVFFAESYKKMSGHVIENNSHEYKNIQSFIQQGNAILKENDTSDEQLKKLKACSNEWSGEYVNFYELMIDVAIEKNDLRNIVGEQGKHKGVSTSELQSEKYLKYKLSSLEHRYDILRIYNNIFSLNKPEKGQKIPGVDMFGRLALNIIPSEKATDNNIGKVIKEKSNLAGLIIEMRLVENGVELNNYYCVVNSNELRDVDKNLVYNKNKVIFVTEDEINKISKDNGFPLKNYHLYLDNLNDSQINNLYIFAFNSILDKDIKSQREIVKDQYSEMVRLSEMTMSDVMLVALGYYIRPMDLYLQIDELKNEGFFFDFQHLKNDFFKENVVLKQNPEFNGKPKEDLQIVGIKVAPISEGKEIAESIKIQIENEVAGIGNWFNQKLSELRDKLLPNLYELDVNAVGNFEDRLQKIEDTLNRLPLIQSPLIEILTKNPSLENPKQFTDAYAQGILIQATLASLKTKIEVLIKNLISEIDAKELARKKVEEDMKKEIEKNNIMEQLLEELHQNYPNADPELLNRLAMLQCQFGVAQENIGYVQGKVNDDVILDLKKKLKEYSNEINSLTNQLEEQRKKQIPIQQGNDDIARQEANARYEAELRDQADRLRQLQAELAIAAQRQQLAQPETPEDVYRRTGEPIEMLRQAVLLNKDNSYINSLPETVKRMERGKDRNFVIQQFRAVNSVIADFRRNPEKFRI